MSRQWTVDEDAKLLELIESGVRRYKLPLHFPDRTEASVKTRADRLDPPESAGGMAERSRQLAEAINSLFERMPARKVAEVIGKPHLAHVLRAPYKTQSALRELAA
jgi:hypothetical protein